MFPCMTPLLQFVPSSAVPEPATFYLLLTRWRSDRCVVQAVLVEEKLLGSRGAALNAEPSLRGLVLRSIRRERSMQERQSLVWNVVVRKTEKSSLYISSHARFAGTNPVKRQ
jgi:hypothetical protein